MISLDSMLKVNMLQHIYKRSIRLASKSSKPLFVTSPIFYVNAKPHLGHLYSMLLCDVRSRWNRLHPGTDTFFLTGTDEHGLKIQTAAEKIQVNPKDLTDQVSENFKLLAQEANIGYDRFIRTTDSDHIETVQYFWNLMKNKGYLYVGSHSGWYAISDETFYPENQTIEVTDPHTGRKKRISKETRSEVVYQEEQNYFFKLSQFQDELIAFLEKNDNFILPRIKYEELLKELKSTELQDLSVSRPSSRLSWGIDVPGDPSQKIYVWFDALLNYLTACGFPNKFIKQKNGSFNTVEENPWPPIHVIGKDIIRFHCIYWPIFLMAAQVELPKKIIVHSHWLCDGFKMSKSLGNVVDPMDTIAYYGADSLRFFLAEYSTLDSDCNYIEQNLHFTRDNLIGKYANLILRCCAKSFDIAESIESYKKGQYDDIDSLIEEYPANDAQKENIEEIILLKRDLSDKLASLPNRMDTMISVFDTMKAIQSWWSVIEDANRLFQLGQPWVFTKALKGDLSVREREAYRRLQDYYVFVVSDICRICSILISPFMPELSFKLLDKLRVKNSNRSFDYANFGADSEYGSGSNSSTDPLPITRIPIRS